jgi:hypothetical protein
MFFSASARTITLTYASGQCGDTGDVAAIFFLLQNNRITHWMALSREFCSSLFSRYRIPGPCPATVAMGKFQKKLTKGTLLRIARRGKSPFTQDSVELPQSVVLTTR